MIGADSNDLGTQFSGMDAASASNASTGSDQYNEGSWFEAAPPAPSTPSEPYVMNPEVRDVYRDYVDMHGGSADLLGPRTFDPYTPEPVSPGGFFDRYSLPEYDYAPVSHSTRSLSSVAPATAPTNDSLGFLDRYSRPEYDYLVPNVTTDTSGKAQLESIVANGFGSLKGLNPNNPDQTAQQLLNSFRANDFLTEYAPALFTAGMPQGMGLAFNAIRSGADVLSGRTTPGQALTSVGLEALASKLGIPGGGRVVGDLLEGRVGPAAGGAAAGLVTGIAGRAGLGPVAGPLLNELGITPAISRSVSGAVQPQPGQGTGVVSSLADAINKGAQGIMGLFGGTPAAAIPATPGTGTTRGYTPPDYNQYESSAYEPTTAPAPAAAPAVEPETAAARRLLYGMAQGPYGPLLAYDFVGEA